MIHHRGVFGGHPVGRRGGVADAHFVHVALLRLRMAGERAKADAVHERLGDVPVLLVQVPRLAVEVAPGNGVPHAAEVAPGAVGLAVGGQAERRVAAAVVDPAGVQLDPHAGQRVVGRRKGDETGVLVVVRLDVGLEDGDRERPDRRFRGEGRRNEEAARREGVVAELADHRAARRRRGGGVGRYCVRKREGVGLVRLVGLPAVNGGIRRIGAGAVRKELVHVPDANVVRARPDFRGRRDCRTRVPVDGPLQRERRIGGEFRHRDPEERFALGVPGIDLERQHCAGVIEDPELVRRRAVRVGEANRRRGGNPQKHREVLERRRRRGREGDFRIVEFVTGRRRRSRA